MPIVMTPKASPVYEHFDSTCCGRGIDVKDVKSVSNSDTTQGSYKFRQIAAFITGLMAKKKQWGSICSSEILVGN
ncbi:hypothetical protein [Vibrio parahaemolyticus]|uniref:hypothetical protein n=1 Tax=Vibrio parahaemolyticus TaxID=670 RepID=UPI00111E098A|nr:hypothetical protein [Vibrio parahaemolyticus]TOE30879.1 hypothetical protein CGJ46_21585 [Vibrio parahaemolyticus]